MQTKLNLVSLEVAEKLKHIGFDYECCDYFDVDNIYNGDWKNYNESETSISIPYAHIVLQYFREKYDIDVFVVKVSNVTIYKLGYNFTIYIPDIAEPIYGKVTYESYEDAEIGAIEFILSEMTDYGEE